MLGQQVRERRFEIQCITHTIGCWLCGECALIPARSCPPDFQIQLCTTASSCQMRWCCWLSSVSPSTLLLAGSCRRTRQTGSHHLQGSKCRCLILSGHFGRVPCSWVVGELQETRKDKGVPVWLGLTYIQLARWQQVGNLPVYLVVCLLRLWPASCRQCTHPATSCTASW